MSMDDLLVLCEVPESNEGRTEDRDEQEERSADSFHSDGHYTF